MMDAGAVDARYTLLRITGSGTAGLRASITLAGTPQIVEIALEVLSTYSSKFLRVAGPALFDAKVEASSTYEMVPGFSPSKTALITGMEVCPPQVTMFKLVPGSMPEVCVTPGMKNSPTWAGVRLIISLPECPKDSFNTRWSLAEVASKMTSIFGAISSRSSNPPNPVATPRDLALANPGESCRLPTMCVTLSFTDFRAFRRRSVPMFPEPIIATLAVCTVDISCKSLPKIDYWGLRRAKTSMETERGSPLIAEMPLVILAGGLGTRIASEGEMRPKTMLDVGDRPIIWHIMKHYSSFGVKEFIICLGHKGNIIRDYFLSYHSRDVSISLDMSSGKSLEVGESLESEDWMVHLAETGRQAMTGARLASVSSYIGDRTFLMTYGDGLSDVDVPSLVKFHRSHEGMVTLTSVHPKSRFGHVTLNTDGMVTDFSEKPISKEWINGGHFVVEPQALSYINGDEPWESGPLQRLTREGRLHAFRHEGFFMPIDTQRELAEANEIWLSGTPPWRTW